MKVLFVDQFGKTTGQATLALSELIHENSDIEMEAYISALSEIRADYQYSIKINKGFYGAYEGNILHKVLCYLRSLAQLYKHIRKNKYDIVHLQWFSIPWIEWMYVRLLKKQCKVVITIHDIIPFDIKLKPITRFCYSKLYSGADYLVVHTEQGKELFNKNYKVNTPIKVSTQAFYRKSDYSIIDKKLAKKHFGITDDRIVILYFGTIRKSKGLNVLIRAFHDAYAQNKKIYLLAAGAFQKVDQDEYYRLVEDNLKDDNATVHFKFVPLEEEKWYFNAADMLCLPYLEISQSGIANLGLMYELPMIATNIGEMSKVIRNNVNGLLVEANSVEALSTAILEMSKSSEKRQEFSRMSKEIGEKEFSLEIKANDIESVMRKDA